MHAAEEIEKLRQGSLDAQTFNERFNAALNRLQTLPGYGGYTPRERAEKYRHSMRESLRSQVARVMPTWQICSLAEIQAMAVVVDSTNEALKSYKKPDADKPDKSDKQEGQKGSAGSSDRGKKRNKTSASQGASGGQHSGAFGAGPSSPAGRGGGPSQKRQRSDRPSLYVPDAQYHTLSPGQKAALNELREAVKAPHGATAAAAQADMQGSQVGQASQAAFEPMVYQPQQAAPQSFAPPQQQPQQLNFGRGFGRGYIHHGVTHPFWAHVNHVRNEATDNVGTDCDAWNEWLDAQPDDVQIASPADYDAQPWQHMDLQQAVMPEPEVDMHACMPEPPPLVLSAAAQGAEMGNSLTMIVSACAERQRASRRRNSGRF